MKQFGPVTKLWKDRSARTPITDISKIRKMAEKLYKKNGGAIDRIPAPQWLLVAFAAENRARTLLKKRKLAWQLFTEMVLKNDKTLLVGNECLKAALKYLHTERLTPPIPHRATAE